MIGAIVPRPIALVSTINADGKTNLAPFSFFNGLSSTPPILGVSVGTKRGKIKDTWRNAEETGEFVVNVVTESITDPMVQASADYPPEVSEFGAAGLTPIPSDLVAPPRVKESPVHFECRLEGIVELGDEEVTTGLLLGRIVRIHVDDEIIPDGTHIDPVRLKAVGRMGRHWYSRTRELFEKERPEV